MTHRWSGWPGAFCLDCGTPHGLEDALLCSECRLPDGPDGRRQEVKLCEAHAAWERLSCPPDPDDLEKLNAMLEELYAREEALEC